MVLIVLASSLILSMPLLNKKVPFIVIAFLLLLIFIAFRFGFGTDYFNYQQMYDLIQTGINPLESNEILYFSLNKYLPSFDALIMLTSLFYIIVFFIFTYKNVASRYYFFAMFIFLINPYMFLLHQSSIRQTLAICFFVIAVYFGRKRQIIPYVLLVLIAFGFHSSAIFLLPIYFILTEKPVNIKRLTIISIVFSIFMFSNLFTIVIEYLLQFAPLNYSYYYEQDVSNSLLSTLSFVVLLGLIIWQSNKLEGKYIVFGKLGVLSTFLSIMSYNVTMVSRIGLYFDVYLIVLFPYIYSKMTNNFKKLIFVSIIVFVYSYRFISFFNDPIWESFRNYESILHIF